MLCSFLIGAGLAESISLFQLFSGFHMGSLFAVLGFYSNPGDVQLSVDFPN